MADQLKIREALEFIANQTVYLVEGNRRMVIAEVVEAARSALAELEAESRAPEPAAPAKCPTCDSPKPHLHPAVQFESEVELCRDNFHRRVTPENTVERIATNDAQLKSEAAVRSPEPPTLPIGEDFTGYSVHSDTSGWIISLPDFMEDWLRRYPSEAGLRREGVSPEPAKEEK